MKSTKTGKPTFSPEEASNFVRTFCQATTYQEVADKLKIDVNLVMYNAQILRAKGIELPYIKFAPPALAAKVSPEIDEPS